MHVSSQSLYRLGGAAAMVGGSLRVLLSFIPYREETVWLEALYALVDICLLVGLTAIYLKRAERLGGLGLAAFILSGAGLASIVGPDTIMFGVNFYEVGALLTIAGVVLLSIQLLRHQILQWVSSLWIMSFGLSVATVSVSLPVLFIGAGISFGVAFTLAGFDLVQNAKSLDS